MAISIRALIFLNILTLSACQSIKTSSEQPSVPNSSTVSTPSEKVDLVEANRTLYALLATLSEETGLSFSIQNEYRAQDTLENNYTHQLSEWIDEENSAVLSMTPTRTYQPATDSFCRDYNVRVTQGPKTAAVNGIACRLKSGVWMPAKKPEITIKN